MIQGVKILASCIKRPFQALIITKQSVLLRNHQKLSPCQEILLCHQIIHELLGDAVSVPKEDLDFFSTVHKTMSVVCHTTK
jgi:hypothetical protein